MDFQFYPTPLNLAIKAWGLFRNREFNRVLEPSAGKGDLVQAVPRHSGRAYFDVCEIDPSMHSALRQKYHDVNGIAGISIVGYDFMQLEVGAMYSHVIMNPPFAYGVQHLLHAWNIVWDAEIVCFLNAESILNPCTAERRRLVELIKLYGSVEYIKGGFSGDDSERHTDVDVALVWLKKSSEVGSFVVSSILDGLSKDKSPDEVEKFEQFDLVIPGTVIENYVVMFDQAVEAARESVKYKAKADFLGNRLGKKMSELMSKDEVQDGTSSAQKATSLFGDIYRDLKDRAWANLLQTADFTTKLSSGAQKKVYEQFEQIKQMQFTSENVYGFLRGITESQNEIQNDMICEIFDLVTKYHSGNVAYYKGWKSNDKHRAFGMRLKTTRFVIPNCGDNYFKNSVNYGTKQMLRDMDKVFSLLDGVDDPEISLYSIFDNQLHTLCNGERITGSYFSCRFFKGIGTIHFFPTRPDLMDKLNLIVGKQRQWLPPKVTDVPQSFWKQYEKAESMDKEMRSKGLEEIVARLNWMSETEKLSCSEKVDKLLTTVHMKNGIQSLVLGGRENSSSDCQMLLLAE